jgi:glycosyltransferase involved in cell wall biosynthesis
MSEDKELISVSICLTNYNRSKLLYESVSNLLFDNRVTEIVISDDASRPEIYQSVVWYFKEHPKVKIYRNEKNLDCYHNKAKALSLAQAGAPSK